MSIELLMSEHQTILRVLDALAACARRLSAGEPVERMDMVAFADFLQGYADHGHHAKEEEILFEVMLDNGFPKETGPIACMLVEHDEGRALVRSLREASANPPAWDGADKASVAATCTRFVELLRQHIRKEDRVLYPMAQKHLSVENMDAVNTRCASFQQAWEASGDAATLHTTADRLTARYV